MIEKTSLKDFEFFLGQGNFLKVVDTLNKFEDNILDKNSPKAREFILFKRQLYAMYEVQNRSVNEHELFSFEIDRNNLRWLYNSNTDFIQEIRRGDTLDQLADYARLGPNEVFRRRALNPRRLKGITSLAASFGFYSYAPYLAVYLGSTVPVLGAVAAGLFGMLQFSESQIVNSITIVKEGEHKGYLKFNINTSPFTSENIVVDSKDVQSVVALGNDGLGVENQDGNVIVVKRFYCSYEGHWIEEQRALTLPGDAFRDRTFLDWILADKSGEGSLAADFQDLMIKQYDAATKGGKISNIDSIAARDSVTLLGDADVVVDAQIRAEDPTVDQVLSRLAGLYGADHLKSLSDREMYTLYKQHAISNAK